MAKRSSGEGLLKKRPDGSWRGAVWVLLPDGSRKRVWRYGPTEKAVKAKLAEVRAEAAQGIDPTEEKLSFTSWLERWLDELRPVEVRTADGLQWTGPVRYQTYLTYEKWAAVLKERLGNHLLRALRPDQFTALYKSYADRPRSAQHLHQTARRALNRAVATGMLAKNPCVAALQVKGRRRKMAPPSLEELRMLLSEAGKAREGRRAEPLLAAFCAVLAYTGCRPSEALGLRWADVDWERSVVSVRRTRLTYRSDPRVEPLKTEESARDVQADGKLFDRLRALREWQGHKPADVFAGPDGKVVTYSALAQRFGHLRAHLKLAGHYRPYDLRHCHATTLLEAGAPLPMVSKRLGHKTSQVTADVYSHLRTAQDAKLGGMFGAALGE